jgi:hypothetical protein
MLEHALFVNPLLTNTVGVMAPMGLLWLRWLIVN